MILFCIYELIDQIYNNIQYYFIILMLFYSITYSKCQLLICSDFIFVSLYKTDDTSFLQVIKSTMKTAIKISFYTFGLIHHLFTTFYSLTQIDFTKGRNPRIMDMYNFNKRFLTSWNLVRIQDIYIFNKFILWFNNSTCDCVLILFLLF